MVGHFVGAYESSVVGKDVGANVGFTVGEPVVGE